MAITTPALGGLEDQRVFRLGCHGSDSLFVASIDKRENSRAPRHGIAEPLRQWQRRATPERVRRGALVEGAGLRGHARRREGEQRFAQDFTRTE